MSPASHMPSARSAVAVTQTGLEYATTVVPRRARTKYQRSPGVASCFRCSLGGIQTDLESRALDKSGNPIPGLYAVGEAAGFGGGGLHGKRSLEGTFLGGCAFSARLAAKSIAAR
jgi:predicted oxidoreductase